VLLSDVSSIEVTPQGVSILSIQNIKSMSSETYFIVDFKDIEEIDLRLLSPFLLQEFLI
jgi:hypothetical protein